MFKFPCEIIIQFVLPAMRKEMVLWFKDEKKLKQREIAKILGITDAAVSQYVKGKRGAKFQFDANAKKKIKEMCNELYNHYQEHKKNHNGSEFMANACEICKELRSSKALCHLHNEIGIDIGNCEACMGV